MNNNKFISNLSSSVSKFCITLDGDNQNLIRVYFGIVRQTLGGLGINFTIIKVLQTSSSAFVKFVSPLKLVYIISVGQTVEGYYEFRLFVSNLHPTYAWQQDVVME